MVRLVLLDPWVDVAHGAIVYGTEFDFVAAFQFACQGAMAELVWPALARYGSDLEGVGSECHAEGPILEVGGLYRVLELRCWWVVAGG